MKDDDVVNSYTEYRKKNPLSEQDEENGESPKRFKPHNFREGPNGREDLAER